MVPISCSEVDDYDIYPAQTEKEMQNKPLRKILRMPPYTAQVFNKQ